LNESAPLHVLQAKVMKGIARAQNGNKFSMINIVRTKENENTNALRQLLMKILETQFNGNIVE
jgi:hypothetical protein